MEQAGKSIESQDPEVVPRAYRRQYTAAYKQQILEEYDRCTAPGEKGAILRREGLYTSNITSWRQQREREEQSGLGQQKRGPKTESEAVEIVRLRRENERLKKRLEQAELIIEVQKKISQILGVDVEGTK